MALGGHDRETGPKITSLTGITRDGMILSDFDLSLFAKPRRKRLVASRWGEADRISKRGRLAVRAQCDNKGT